MSLSAALAAARDTKILEIGEDVLGKTGGVFRELYGDRPALIVADTNTFSVAGRQVAESLAPDGNPKPFVFPLKGLYAEHGFVEQLEQLLRATEAVPVAVGSGTINDLTKLAAHRVGRPYLSVATAASMDGYTAFGASITYRGSKQTFSCPAPAAVIADLEVIRNAPALMNAWGYSDLIAKVTSGADWILADALEAEPIEPLAWSIVQGSLREMVADPAGVARGESGAIGKLVEGLMLAGFAMQAIGSSRPASGAEHQFSHLWDMQHHTHNGAAPSHGFKVGIATITVTGLYEFFLAQPIERLDVDRCCETWPDEASQERIVRDIFAGADFVEHAVAETMAKYVSREQLRTQLTILRQVWPNLREKLQRQLILLVELKQMLQAVGAPTEPEQIGISRERLKGSFRQAYHIRRRFTILDALVRTGLLEEAIG